MAELGREDTMRGSKGHPRFLVKRWITLVVLALLLAYVPLAHAQERKTLRVVFVSLSWNSEIPFRVALARGYFKSQGLEIEPIFIRGGPAAMAALLSGQVDYASIGGAQAVIRAKAHGSDLAIIGSISNRTNYILLGNKQTRSVESLKGKTIGVTGAGAFSEFAVRTFLKQHNIDPSKDVVLRAVGNTTLRAIALEKGLVAAAPFSPEDAVRLMKSGYSLISNFAESLDIPQSILVTREEVIQKHPETTKRFLKALILGINLAKNNKKEAIKAGYEAGLQGDRDTVNAAYDLYAPALTSDLSINVSGIQLMLDEDIRAGLADSKLTVDKVIDDRMLKKAQEELRAEGRLKP
ncbi:MAG TPA: ABC transporter substrate-binding protein [Fimbriimonadales bacterium]|nr:ABC transporter substrate-binding protein [Fimbriimonadales bacterium]